MIYFFHHYELPVIIQQATVQQILRIRTRQRHQQQNGNGAHGAANNATNMRNSLNTSNQANNDAMGTNQMNNNDNHRNGNLLSSIAFILNFQMASNLFNRMSTLLQALQVRLTNDLLGTTTLLNNNIDNSLNNNNNNSTANFSRLTLGFNLSRLRRINLAGIQINPIQINPASNTESIHLDRDEAASNGTATAEMNMGETSTSHSNESSQNTSMANTNCAPGGDESDFQLHTLTDGDADFQARKIPSEPSFYSNGKTNEGTSIDYEIEFKSLISGSAAITKSDLNNTTTSNDMYDLSKETQCIDNEMDSVGLTNAEGDDLQSQRIRPYQTESNAAEKSLEDFPMKSPSGIQGNGRDLSLVSTDIGICTELDRSNMLSTDAVVTASKVGESSASVNQKAIDIITPNIESTFSSSAADANNLITSANSDEQ